MSKQKTELQQTRDLIKRMQAYVVLEVEPNLAKREREATNLFGELGGKFWRKP